MARGATRPDAGAAKAEPHKRVTIGRYRIKSRLGRGGMGMVYRGVDDALEREVAVKTLTADGNFDEENRQRFEIEAKAAARLQHPNIVTVFELGEDRGVPYIAMELLPGGDLESLLRSGEPLSVAERLDIVTQVCRGLAFAHEHKVIHRDVKPSNIRLLDDGSVKIMDFGIAKLGSTNVTKSGMMVGTLNYMSPEQIRGLQLDGRSDVFSVGVILFQMLAGRRPFVGTGGPDVLYKIVQDPTPALGVDLGPETSRLQEIVNRALEKDPQHRYASASELADDLEGLRRGLLERARQPSLLPAEQELLSGARRALKDGQLDDAQRRLQPVLARAAVLPDVQRLLRAIKREQERLAKPPAGTNDEFPELEATYRAQVTQRTPEPPAIATAPPAPPPGVARFVVPIAVLMVLASIGASVLLLRQRDERPLVVREEALPIARPVAQPIAVPPKQSTALPGPVRPNPVALPVESEPAGASLSLDGQRAGTTPASLSVDPASDHKLVVSLDGFVAQEVKLAAGKLPQSLQLALVPAGPPGTLAVLSSYPVDVVWKGKPLAKAQLTSTLSLPPGRHTLSLLAPTHFLKKDVVVEIKSGGSVGIETPGLGKLSVKANPDTCEVIVDGAFVDFPPILDRAISEGVHTVTFKWPDGVKRDETIEVVKGKIAYVMGRR